MSSDQQFASLRLLCVDDEPPALDEMRYLLSEIAPGAEVMTNCSVTDAIARLEQETVDIVLLDIEMAEQSGLEAAGRIRSLRDAPAIVFVTAYAEHAVAAFDVDAVDYVLKPVRRERLTHALSRALERRTAPRPVDPTAATESAGFASAGTADVESAKIPIDIGGRTVFIDRSSVAVVEASRDYVRLHVRSDNAVKSYLFRAPISTLESAWAGAGFVRVHRGYLVALNEIRELRSDGSGTSIVVLGMEIPVGRTYLRPLKDRLLHQ
jgi:two-component system, LytTR family, response regulator LytT